VVPGVIAVIMLLVGARAVFVHLEKIPKKSPASGASQWPVTWASTKPQKRENKILVLKF
jgi:hypothetical protein